MGSVLLNCCQGRVGLGGDGGESVQSRCIRRERHFWAAFSSAAQGVIPARGTTAMHRQMPAADRSMIAHSRSEKRVS
jgi:hypothetical protein